MHVPLGLETENGLFFAPGAPKNDFRDILRATAGASRKYWTF